MKLLNRKPLASHGAEFANKKYDYQHSLQYLLCKLEKEMNPLVFKEQLLAITQLYFDGLVEVDKKNHSGLENVIHPENWPEQEAILNALISSGKIAIWQYHNSEEVDTNKIKNIILPFADGILKYGRKTEVAKLRHLSTTGYRLRNFTDALQKIVGTKIVDLASIVCVASGGFEPSYLAANIAGLEKITAIRYSRYAQHDKQILVPRDASHDYLESAIRKKNVLVVDDFILNGKTMLDVLKEIIAIKPTALYCAVVNDYRVMIAPSLWPYTKVGMEIISKNAPTFWKAKLVT
jgi:hypoxanthine phosphoribosyltransferase